MALKKIDKYQILGKIGEGGMGAVYKAAHPTLKRPVILKQLTIKQNPNIIERFKREARIMLDLRDEHIVQVYDHFKEGSSYFIVMEYVHGISLDKLIREKRYLSNEAAILIFLEICKGLKFAHDKGVIHRDIKPANVLISKEGEVKLVDFGIATSKEDVEQGLTKAGSTLGTPAYMPPEQISNPQSVDKRSDIYAMGVLLYNMTTGKLPYPVNMMPATIIMIEKGRYQKPNNINPKISALLQSIIKKTMMPKRSRRYKDLHIVISKLERKLKGGFSNQKVINHAIKNYIEGKDINFKIKKVIKEEEKKKVFRFPALSKVFIMLLFIFGLSFSYLIKTGYIFEYLFTDKYGSFEASVNPVNKIALKKDKQIIANIYKKNKDGSFSVMDKSIFFNKHLKKETNFIFYKTPRIYLRSADYKIEVNINNEKYSKEFFVTPKILGNTNGEVKIDYKSIPVIPVEINFAFYDASNNGALDGVQAMVYDKAKWVDWEYFKKHNYYDVTSGKSFNFLFYRRFYQTKKLFVSGEPYQSVLNVDVVLERTPGLLNVKINDSKIKFYINKSKYYISASDNPEIKKTNIPFYKIFLHDILEKMGNKDSKLYTKLHIEIFNEKQLLLTPGIYRIKAGRIKLFSFAEAEKEIEVRENMRNNLSIFYNSNNKSLSILGK